MRSTGLIAFAGLALIGLFLLGGCGGDDNGVGISIQVDVSPASATVGLGMTLQVSAVVIEGSSDDITWYVNDILGGNATVGTVTQTNPTIYSAPATLPDPETVVVKAVSTQDTTKFDTCIITLTEELVVQVLPATATIAKSGSFSITANVSGGTTNAVQWYVNGVLSGNVLVGTITQANPAVYTAPGSVPSPATVVVKSVSTENASKYDSCLVTIVEPPNISVQVSIDRRIVEVSEAFNISATVTGGTTNQVQWYVNSTPGGNSTLGTITQANPATYTAPDGVPAPDSVRVIAVSQEDVSKSDTCIVKIAMTVIHVSASAGSDATGTGTASNPVKSIKRGLQIAEAGETVLVAPGLYDAANGEQFPIYVNNRSLVGENWETCVIRGHEEASYCIGMENASAVRKFTLEEGPAVEYGWVHAIYLSGAGGLVDSVRCFERAYYAVVRIPTTQNATVQNCVFDVRAISEVNRGFNRGFEIVFNDEGTILRNCIVRGFHNGGAGTAIFFNGSSNALIEDCIIEDNGYGLSLCCAGMATHNPAPDLGGGARGSTGGNTIRNNTACGLHSESANDIFAKYNTWANNPPVLGDDYCLGGTGSVIVE